MDKSLKTRPGKSRFETVREELRSKEPDLMREYELLYELQAFQYRSKKNDLQTIKGPWLAVQTVLTERGTWMTKQEIIDRLTDGGFISSRAEKWSVNTVINTRVEQGDLKTKGHGEKMNLLVGLPSF